MSTLETQERTFDTESFDGTEMIEDRLDRAAELSDSIESESVITSENAGQDTCPRLGVLRAKWESPSQLAAGVMAVSLLGGLFSIYFLPTVTWFGVMFVAALVAFAGFKLGGKRHTWHYLLVCYDQL